MEEVKLLGAWPSPFSYRVIWALKLKGIKYEYIEENIFNKSALLLQYNPVYKKIPVLVHGGNLIAESIIILEYMEETWPKNPLLPKDAYRRAEARFWAKFCNEKSHTLFAFFRTVREEQEKAIKDAMEVLGMLEEHGSMREKKFFGGDEVGLADIVLGWLAHWLEVMEEAAGVKLLEEDSFPHLHAWIGELKEVPMIRDNLPDRNEMMVYFKRRMEMFLESTTP